MNDRRDKQVLRQRVLMERRIVSVGTVERERGRRGKGKEEEIEWGGVPP